MIYTTCVMFYATFSHKRSVRGATLVFALVVFIAVFITGYYYYIKDPLFHQNAFALLTAVVFFRSLYGMEVSLRPSRQAKRREEVGRLNTTEATKQARIDKRDRDILKTMYQMIPVGLGSIALGFLIWNLDNAYCPTLRRWRHAVGLPWGILLEGHGWWFVDAGPRTRATLISCNRHIFTGIAQFYNLTWSIWLRYCFDGEQDKVEMVWPTLFTSVPLIERVTGNIRSKVV